MVERIVRIAFRGLMVLNYQGSEGSRFMEIGFLDARSGAAPGGSHVHTPANSAVHIPRVLTTENGVLSEVFDLRTQSELGTVRRWSLNVIPAPQQAEVTLRGGSAPPANRGMETAANKQDFGWIIDMENSEMHQGNLGAEISTAKLLMVLTVNRGEFFSKLLSRNLVRKEIGGGDFRPFGKVAAVTGLDIICQVPTVDDEAKFQLMAGTKVIRTFETQKDSRVFEISNAPAEVYAEGSIPKDAPGHFHMYYDKMFIKSPPNQQFDFKAIGPAPGPDPALCGVISLGERDEPL